MKKLLAGAAIALAPFTTLLAPASPAHADVFDECPDGHEGVVGDHTSCPFAENVRRVYYGSGLTEFRAWSPVTEDWYWVTCGGTYTANFTYGDQRIATHCWTVDSNAEVVIW